METRPAELINMFIIDTFECSFRKKLSLSPVCFFFKKKNILNVVRENKLNLAKRLKQIWLLSIALEKEERDYK